MEIQHINPSVENGFKYLMLTAALLTRSAEKLGIEENVEALHKMVCPVLDAIINPEVSADTAAEMVIKTLHSVQAQRKTIYKACLQKHGIILGGIKILKDSVSLTNLQNINWLGLPQKVKNRILRKIVQNFYPRETIKEIAQKMRWDALKVVDPIKSAQLSFEATRLTNTI